MMSTGVGVGVGVSMCCGSSGGELSPILHLYDILPNGKIDYGLWEDARVSDISIPDYNDILTTIPPGVPVIVDSITGRTPRVVENQLLDSVDLSGWVIGAGVVVTDLGDGVYEIDMSAVAGNFWVFYLPNIVMQQPTGLHTVSSYEMRVISYAGEPRIVLTDPNNDTNKTTVTLTQEWQRVRHDQVNPIDISGMGLKTPFAGSNRANVIQLRKPQYEITENFPDQTIPSEYVESSGTKGTAYYQTTNGNTVDANGIVTEGVGDPIDHPGEWAFEHWPASTNYFLTSDVPATQTINLANTGTYTLSMTGTGSVDIAADTAVGTGFGTATEGNPVTVEITGAGTVICTVNGSVDTAQLEASPFATPYIPTEGTAVSRDATHIRHPSAGYNNMDEGMLVLDCIRNDGSDVDYILGPGGSTLTMGFLTTSGATGQSYQQGITQDDMRNVIYDGVNAQALTGINWRPSDRLLYSSRWNTNIPEMQPGSRDKFGNWRWASAAAYDGSFAGTGYWELFKNQVQNCRATFANVYGKDMGSEWIESSIG
jgi:hypothetical protein